MVLLPIVLFGGLQLSGCTRLGGKPTPSPAPPGGTYISTSAGAFFDQSVNRNDAEDQYISLFTLYGLHRPDFSPQTIYVAAGQAGIVVSEDNAQSWRRISVPVTTVTDVVALANGVIVVAGTHSDGQGYILRTIDEAKSWETVLTVPRIVTQQPTQRQFIKPPASSTNTTSQSIVVTIAPDPFHDDQLYAGTTLGNLLVGEQSGKTWRTIRNLNGNQNSIRSVVPSPHIDGEVVLLTTTGSAIVVSNTEGFVLKVPGNLDDPRSTFSQGPEKQVKSLTYVAQFPDAFFVGIDDGAAVTTDRGTTWRRLPVPADTTKAFNTLVVAVSPTNPARLLVAINNVVYRSEDGGETWNTFLLPIQNIVVLNLSIDPTNAAHVLATTRILASE